MIRLKTENNEENINKDIEAFVSHEIDKSRTDTNTQYDNLLNEDIRNTPIARADGMFLLVSLIVEDLKTTPTDQIRGKLQIIPSSLGGFYQALLDRVFALPEDAVQTIKQILMWVVSTPRPMSIEELAWACKLRSEHRSAA